MNEENVQQLIDKAVAGRLSPEEEFRWTALLAERPDLEEDLALGELLRAIPAPPALSSNFTAQVLQQVQKPKRRQRTVWSNWFRWPQFAQIGAAAVVVLGVGFGLMQQQRKVEPATEVAQIGHAEEAAQTIADGVKAVSSSPGVETQSALQVFQDFEAIRQLPPNTPGVDYTLLTALRQ